jgi:hypothetical protein
MTLVTAKLTVGWRWYARGSVQDVCTSRVTQGRSVPFFRKGVGTQLKRR